METLNCSDKYLSSTASIVLSVWFSLSGLAAVTGNAVVLWLFYKNGSLRTISNRFLASLSFADGLVGLAIDPFWIVTRFWIQPSVYSNLFRMTLVLWAHTTAATTLNSCCVSIDRFIAIRFPLRYRNILSKRRCFVVIISVWFISVSLPFPLLFFRPGEDRILLVTAMVCTAFVFPLIVISFCYMFIYKLARKQYRRVLEAEGPPDSGVKVRTMQNYKAIKTVGFVLGAYTITWIPSVVLLLFNFYIKVNRCKNREIKFLVWPWVEAIAFTSSAINPLIYYFRNSELRRAFRRTFHWLPCVHEKNAKPERNRNRMERNIGTYGNLGTKETKL